MAHPLCFSKPPIPPPLSSFLPPPPSSKLSNPTFSFKIKPKLFSLRLSQPNKLIPTHPKTCCPRAAPQDTESNGRAQETQSQPTNSDSKAAAADGGGRLDDEVSRLASRIREAANKKPDSLSGVVEEIREIDWPAFNKVLGTTGVVLGVIAGSSVILLTLNAILAELSDRVFAGMGVQDFFR
ncbi:unnamed protein product [Cuscuta campestris]|uniref:Preprotein translocase subunit SECE1 n=1 Tax=Cuscuta campestris TaxID=132261 RepID=A0A484LJI9_9ASTE|nr:unnamed protein product [Cuscuta campestris]